MNIPKLYIRYAYPFDNNRRRLYEVRNLGEYPAAKEVMKTVDQWQRLWASINADDRIFQALIDTLGVSVPRDLELYVFGAGMNAMSNPLMMPIVRKDTERFSDDQFTETAIHELVHRFVDRENHPGIENFWKFIREEFASESTLTQNHLIVYAVLKIVLGNLFPEKVQGFFKPVSKDYQKALNVVDERGPDYFVNKFREYLKT